MSSELIFTGLFQGLILAFVAYGVMIPFRLLNCADLSAEGAYPLGAAVSTSLLLAGVPSVLAICLAGIASGFMGFCTALIHLRLKVNSLLAGIIVSIMVYSINLRLLGKPNIALFEQAHFFSSTAIIQNALVALFFLMTMLLPLYVFLKTDYGLKLRTVGLNQKCAIKHNISISAYTSIGFFIASSFHGVSGALMVELQQYMDIGMGVGIVIHALAALMIGEVIVGQKTLNQQLLAPLVGALVYQQIQGMILNLGLAPSDLKCFTGAFVLLIIGLKQRSLKYV